MRENHIETIFKVSKKEFEAMSCWDKLGLDAAEMKKLDQKQRSKVARKAWRMLLVHCHPDKKIPGRDLYYFGIDNAVAEIESNASLTPQAPTPKGGGPLPAIEAAPKSSSSSSFFRSPAPSSRATGPKISARIYFLGEVGSGTSSLIDALLDKPFDAKKTFCSMGCDFVVADSDNYQCQFWERPNLKNEADLKFANIRIIVYNSSDENSFQKIKQLMREYGNPKDSTGTAYKVILVSTKNDLENAVESLRGEYLAKDYGASFVAVSSKNDTGIDELRSLIIQQLDILNNRLPSKADSKKTEIPRLTFNESASKSIPDQLLLTDVESARKPGQLLITDSAHKEGGCTIM